jgi:hypothetical protein
MSSKMRDWADNYIQEAISQNVDSSIYYGVTTKAVSKEVREFNDALGKAEILVKTQRREAMGTTSNVTSFQQDILISFIKTKGVWKVDSAIWQER